MEVKHHIYLINMLQEVFGTKLCNDCKVENVTLDYLWEKKYQVRAALKDSTCKMFAQTKVSKSLAAISSKLRKVKDLNVISVQFVWKKARK